MFIYSPTWLEEPALAMLAGGETFANLLPYAIVRPDGTRILIPPSGLSDDFETIIKYPVWTTDEGSIPMLFQNVVQKAGPNTPAFVGHDWLYCSEQFDRETCDAILEEACVEQAGIIHAAVRLGGGGVWEKHDPAQVCAMQAYYKTFLSEVGTRWPELLKTP